MATSRRSITVTSPPARRTDSAPSLISFLFQELIRVALANNYDLKQAVARVEQARNVAVAARAPLFPQVGYGGDVGRGRNAVLYVGEVNWSPEDLEGAPLRIEHVLKNGQSVLVQVTKDPIGGKGARLTAQISLPGRFLVLARALPAAARSLDRPGRDPPVGADREKRLR